MARFGKCRTMAKKDYIAVIPARQGSKRLPGKNLKALMGVPLIGHTIKAALASNLIDKVIVSSDSQEILDYASQFPVATHSRHSSIAQDSTPTSRVLEDLALDLMEYKNTVLLQVTSPLRTFIHIDSAIQIYESSNKTPLKSVVKDPVDQVNRLNGAIYIAKTIELSNSNWEYGKMNFVPYVMDFDDSIDIDTYEDFSLAESILKRRELSE